MDRLNIEVSSATAKVRKALPKCKNLSNNKMSAQGGQGGATPPMTAFNTCACQTCYITCKC